MTGKKRGKKSATTKKSDEEFGVQLVMLLALFAVGWVIVHLIWWILAAALLAAAALGIQAIVRGHLRRREAHSAYQAAMVARADQQYEWAISGDERGIYGNPGARPVEPPRPWSARRLTAVIGGVTTVALVGAFLLVHRPFVLSPRDVEPVQTTLAFSDLDMPLGVAAGPDGAVYVTDAKHDRVLKLAAGAAEQVVLPFAGLSFPECIAVDDRGDVFVGGFNATAHRSTVMELRAGEATATELPMHSHGASGIAVDSAGAVYVTEDMSDGGLYRLAPGAAGPVEMVSGAFSGVAVDASGTIYLTRATDYPNVLKISAGQSVPTPAAFADMDLATGVAVDSAGNVYVSDGWAKALPVYRLAAGHTSATALDVTGLSFPGSLVNGIAVDNDGNLYVVDDKQNRVIKVRAPLKDAL